MARFFADISYPLYVVHGVPGYVLLLVLLNDGWPPAAAILLVTSASIAIAYAVHRLIEGPTHRIGKRLGGHVSARGRMTPEAAAEIGLLMPIADVPSMQRPKATVDAPPTGSRKSRPTP